MGEGEAELPVDSFKTSRVKFNAGSDNPQEVLRPGKSMATMESKVFEGK